MTDINMCGYNIMLQQTVRDIGVFLDRGMDMSAQVSRMCQSAYFQLHNIAKIRHYLTVNACKTIVHALVTSKLYYGNAVLFGINEGLINKLQMTQNSAARLIVRQRRRDHNTPVLIALHWLPIRYRIIYKILVLTFLAIHNLVPAYITDLISAYEPGRQLRSASRLLLTVPRHNLYTFVRVLLVDYSKAFDHINNEILIAKLYDMGLPAYLVRWMAAFLIDRQQSLKIGDTVSSIGCPNGGVPQGTLSGPRTFWFKLMTYKHHATCLNMLTTALYLTFVITVVCLCYKSLPIL